MRNERAWPQQCWKSCANGSNIVALRFGDHGTKEMLGVVGWIVWPVSNFAQQHATTSNRMCKRTQHVTLINVGSCWSTIWRPLARSLKPRPNGRNFVGNNFQHCWMLHDASVCTPCCMLLDVVAQSLKPVKLFSQQLPTFLLFRTYGLFPDEG